MLRTLKSNLLNVLFWSVISAAFIGPGTLTTAVAAGAAYHLSLLWTLLFAVMSCLLFQEMASRMTICSGKDLNEIIRERGRGLHIFIGLSVMLGCGAYEAGNILGAVSGIQLIFPVDQKVVAVVLVVLAFVLLYFNSIRLVSSFLGLLVALMGVVFVVVASQTNFAFGELLVGLLIPKIPEGSEWFILGLVGTTVVPYNLFLGSGLSKGQSIGAMRLGLSVSVLVGGAISMAILVSGMNIGSFDGFSSFAVVLGELLGVWSQYLLGIGLFAAGLTSAITAPLAAGMIGKNIFRSPQGFRASWMSVLLIGLVFGLFSYKPLAVIIAAQVLNGFILPMIALLLIVYANDHRVMGTRINSFWMNAVSVLFLNVLLLIGENNVYNALSQPLGYAVGKSMMRYAYLEAIALPILIATVMRLVYLRKSQS